MNSPPSCRWTGRAELACGCRPGRTAPWRNTTPILASQQVGAWLSLAAGWLVGWCSSPWLRERPDLAATAALPDQTAPLASGLLVDLPRERRPLPPTSAAALIPHTNQLPPSPFPPPGECCGVGRRVRAAVGMHCPPAGAALGRALAPKIELLKELRRAVSSACSGRPTLAMILTESFSNRVVQQPEALWI